MGAGAAGCTPTNLVVDSGLLALQASVLLTRRQSPLRKRPFLEAVVQCLLGICFRLMITERCLFCVPSPYQLRDFYRNDQPLVGQAVGQQEDVPWPGGCDAITLPPFWLGLGGTSRGKKNYWFWTIPICIESMPPTQFDPGLTSGKGLWRVLFVSQLAILGATRWKSGHI